MLHPSHQVSRWLRSRLRLSLGSGEEGLSLVEILVALGILGVVSVLIAQFIPKIYNSRNRIEAISARDGISMRIKRVVSRSNLVFSAQNLADPGNKALLDCVDDDDSTICQTTDIRQPLGFRLGYPRDSASAEVTGTHDNPLLYQRNGGICRAGDRCTPEWEVRSYFTAVCPSQATTCPKAMSIRFRYQLRNIPRLGQPAIPSLPTDEEFADPRNANLNIKIFDPFQVAECPPFSFIESILADGVAVCVCQPGSTKVGVKDGQPVCSPGDLRCPDNLTHRLLGFDSQMKPICVPRKKFQCTNIPTSNACNGIVRSVQLGSCRVIRSASKKKGSNADVTCSQNQFACCTAI